MLVVKDLTVSYQEVPVLANINVTFHSGKITGIIGPNGAGKSTLVKSILGLVKKQNGTISYNDQSIKTIQKQIAYVEQRKNLDLTFPISVFDVVLSGTYAKLGLFKNPGKLEKKQATNALEQVGLLELKNRQIGELSGGQLQRVFVARAIVQDAQVVILDEPFVGIDLQSERAIMNILHDWQQKGKTIIVVHHDLNKAPQYFDDLVILNHGIVDFGPTSAVYKPENIQKAFSADLSHVLFKNRQEDQTK